MIALVQHKSSLFWILMIHFFFFPIFSNSIRQGLLRSKAPPRPSLFTNVSSTKKPSLSGSTISAEFNFRAKSSKKARAYS